MNVVISGLTAAGKTTHAKLLAQELGFEYVSGTGALARLCGLEVTDDPPRWVDIAGAVARCRNDDVDAMLENELLRLAREKDCQVFDAWALAWTCDVPIARIWFESDLPSRTRKCFVSQGEVPSMDLAECEPHVREKDEQNRELFLRTLSFDLFEDHEAFDVVLDNSELIPEATFECAVAGIATFAPIVQRAFEFCVGNVSAAELSAAASMIGGEAMVRFAKEQAG